MSIVNMSLYKFKKIYIAIYYGGISYIQIYTYFYYNKLLISVNLKHLNQTFLKTLLHFFIKVFKIILNIIPHILTIIQIIYLLDLIWVSSGTHSVYY